MSLLAAIAGAIVIVAAATAIVAAAAVLIAAAGLAVTAVAAGSTVAFVVITAGAGSNTIRVSLMAITDGGGSWLRRCGKTRARWWVNFVPTVCEHLLSFPVKYVR